MPIDAQERSGWITGSVTDAAGGILPGARVELQPQGSSAVTNGQGQFTISSVAPGQYKLSVNYVGFAAFSTDVTVAAGQTARVDVVLRIGLQSEVVTVRGDRQRGEVEAIHIERTADNIIQVRRQQFQGSKWRHLPLSSYPGRRAGGLLDSWWPRPPGDRFHAEPQ